MTKNELIAIKMAETSAFVSVASDKGVSKEMFELMQKLQEAINAVEMQVVAEDSN